MKNFKVVLGTIFSVSLIIVLMFTSIQFVAYWIPDYYRNEYTKYGVYETVKTEPDEMDRVTEEMMDYLIGKREKLSDITATVDGVENTYFFNERECAHMDDVRSLFLGGMKLRTICIVVCIVILIVLILMARKNSKGGSYDVLHPLAKGMIIGTGVFTVIVGALAVMFSQNFNKYFTIFHEIFFDNDLWLLDPRTDRLVCIVPEGFFMDTVRNIIIVFAVTLIILLVLSIIYEAKHKKDN